MGCLHNSALILVCAGSVAAGACSSKATTQRQPPPVDQPLQQSKSLDAATLVNTSDATLPADLTDAALPSIDIVDWPIDWPSEREAMTLEYRRAHSDKNATDTTIAPTVIVLHYTAGGAAKSTKQYFDNLTIEPSRKILYAAGKLNVSSHFLVDRDGTIYRLMPETKMARHCIGLNHNAIGIENVGDEAKFPLTDAQVAANVRLVRYLVAKYPAISYLFGHYEVMKMTTSPLFVELDPNFRNSKPDPGPRFMALVRKELTDLGLEGLPAKK